MVNEVQKDSTNFEEKIASIRHKGEEEINLYKKGRIKDCEELIKRLDKLSTILSDRTLEALSQRGDLKEELDVREKEKKEIKKIEKIIKQIQMLPAGDNEKLVGLLTKLETLKFGTVKQYKQIKEIYEKINQILAGEQIDNIEYISNETFLEKILDFRDEKDYLQDLIHGRIDFQTPSTLESHMDDILEGCGYSGYNYSTFANLLQNLIESWRKKGYSLYDLFFNDKIKIKEKKNVPMIEKYNYKDNEKIVINLLIDFYTYSKYWLSIWDREMNDNDFKKFEKIKLSQFKKTIKQMGKVLDDALSHESSENMEHMNSILSEYGHMKGEKYYFNRKIDSLLDMAKEIYSKATERLISLKDHYKKELFQAISLEESRGNESEGKQEEKAVKRLCEIFTDLIQGNKEILNSNQRELGRGVLETGFLYESGGGDLYSLIETEQSYKKIFDEGKLILEYNKGNILECLNQNSVLLDYGCCHGDKAESLLQGIKKPIKYLPVDVNGDFIQESNGKVKALGVDILEGIVSSKEITEPESIKLPENENDIAYFFTGGSIGNYNDEQANKILSETFSPKKGKNLIIDYHKPPKTLQSIENLLKSYHNTPTENWFINGLSNLGIQPMLVESALDDFYPELISNRKDIFEHNNNSNDILDRFKRLLKDLLKYSVRYEFNINGDNYYAELGDDTKIKVFKYTGTSVIECTNREIKQLDKMTKSKEFKGFSGKIVEGFKCTGNIESTYDIDGVKRCLNGPIILNPIFFADNFPVTSKSQLGFAVKSGEDSVFIPIDLKIGEFYPIEISRRFSDEEIGALLDKAGRKVVKKFDKIGDNESSEYLNILVAKSKDE